MPSNETAKTKWAPKRLGWIVLLCAVLALLVYVIIATILTKKPTQSESRNQGQHYTLTIERSPASQTDEAKSQYYLRVARSIDEQQRGLSGTPSLKRNAGIIFMNNEVAERCFWMKDMNYALDIIWLDDKKQVTSVRKNISPDTYPEAYCGNGQYVIELNAGEAARSGLTVGQTVSF